jgi:hypothetical protein
MNTLDSKELGQLQFSGSAILSKQNVSPRLSTPRLCTWYSSWWPDPLSYMLGSLFLRPLFTNSNHVSLSPWSHKFWSFQVCTLTNDLSYPLTRPPCPCDHDGGTSWPLQSYDSILTKQNHMGDSYKGWLPAWNAAMDTSGSQLYVVILRNTSQKISLQWCWSLINPTGSSGPPTEHQVSW